MKLILIQNGLDKFKVVWSHILFREHECMDMNKLEKQLDNYPKEMLHYLNCSNLVFIFTSNS